MGTGNSQNNGTAAGQNLLALPEGVELRQYRIIHTLGQGGFGITYLAEIIGSGEQVVIKENLPTFCAMRNPNTLQVTATNPNDELKEYAKYLQVFVDEARLLAQLNHPNIVKVLGAFEALGTAYYVMPWVGGKELQKAAPAPTDITEQWLLPILRTLLSTLEYLHGMNIYHCDVNPSNILLTENGTPVLIDLGTARTIIRDRSAIHVGCLPWYSPIEQLRSKGKRGPWTDVYSLGAICYRLITGNRPPESIARLAAEEDPYIPLAPRAELRGRFSPAFLATIDKALALRGKNRWQTAAEWLSALPVPAPQPSRRTRPNVALILLILVLTLGIPGGYIFYQTAWQLRDELARVEAEQKPENQLAAKGISESEYGSRIISAARDGDKELLALLIAAGADVNAADKDGRTPLSIAAWKGHSECVKLLLAAPGIDVNKADDYGKTPLYRAAKKGDVECVKLLLAAPGIDVNKADKDGWTPLHWAASEGRSECVKLLLAAPGIDVNKADRWGWTPLYRAACYGRSECVKLLLAAPGIDVNKADNFGETPLYRAATNGHSKCVKLLLAAPGIDVNKADNSGETPLHWAASEGHSECVKLLLAAPGIDVNKAVKDGWTPLHWAASKGRSECVKLLLAAPDIDVNKADEDGMTPLKVAESKGRTECARLIRAAGGKE